MKMNYICRFCNQALVSNSTQTGTYWCRCQFCRIDPEPIQAPPETRMPSCYSIKLENSQILVENINFDKYCIDWVKPTDAVIIGIWRYDSEHKGILYTEIFKGNKKDFDFSDVDKLKQRVRIIATFL